MENEATTKRIRRSFTITDQEDEEKLGKIEELAELDWGGGLLGVFLVV
jgi:hypothetical protein